MSYFKPFDKERPTTGIVVDGACSQNGKSCAPGEYRGIDIETGEIIFHHKFEMTTNNVVEFFAIVHAIKYREEENKSFLPIYSDSQTALWWVKNNNVNTALKLTQQSKRTWAFIVKCVEYLNSKSIYSKENIFKWNTRTWGQIPADFGNK
jgi:ribonuclease HI